LIQRPSGTAIFRAPGVLVIRGGNTAAQALLKGFLRNKLDNYLEGRNEPEPDTTSGLSTNPATRGLT
jgi:deoxyribodipyrimidine photolyase